MPQATLGKKLMHGQTTLAAKYFVRLGVQTIGTRLSAVVARADAAGCHGLPLRGLGLGGLDGRNDTGHGNGNSAARQAGFPYSPAGGVALPLRFSTQATATETMIERSIMPPTVSKEAEIGMSNWKNSGS